MAVADKDYKGFVLFRLLLSSFAKGFCILLGFDNYLPTP